MKVKDTFRRSSLHFEDVDPDQILHVGERT